MQADLEFSQAQRVQEYFERELVPLYQNFKDTSAKREKLYGQADCELEAVLLVEGRLRENHDIINEEFIDKRVLQPFRDIQWKYGELLKLGH